MTQSEKYRLTYNYYHRENPKTNHLKPKLM